jgi:hypothetical protein
MGTTMSWQKEPGDDAIPSPTLERKRRHQADIFLRRHGFEIASRPDPGKGPVRWTRGGKSFTEAEAIAVAERLEQEAKASG